MKIRFPLLVLGYTPQKVFCVESEGQLVLPVFQDGEKAEAYRRFFAREFGKGLTLYGIENAVRALNFFDTIRLADVTPSDVVLDPPPPVDGKGGGLELAFQDFLEQISRRHWNQSRRQARRRGGRTHQPRTKKGRKP